MSKYKDGLLLGLVGNKRVGKDTTANILAEKYGFERLAFAEPLKEVISLLFDIDTSDNTNIDKEELTEYGISRREFYQKFGTDFIHNDIYNYFPQLEEHIPRKLFWIKKIFRKIEKLKKEGKKLFVISDVRFIHEADYILKNGGLLIKITRPEINITKDKHISELEVNKIPKDKIFYEIENKTIEQLDNDLCFKINELFNNS